ncbi:zinc finger BED domain-containing protein DAYSLEEPER-like [Malania oleifera]|uniref:zinc finger BED domain-containing protein DAYSLEEPER-like n=1 Tax=Malania oleifera TaxID=397392 RepID=UPI0025AEB835|nr:zinc finger BED domain-containing protein DAYSLEEPER-like [Malania oleifera]
MSWKDRVNDIQCEMHSFFDEYVKHHSPSTSKKMPSFEATTSHDHGHMTPIATLVNVTLKGFKAFTKEDEEAPMSELEIFFRERMVDCDKELDILDFWRSHEYRYSILSRMTRDILSIPISTIASESTFSIRGKVINMSRSSLTSDNAETIILTRDWLYSRGVEDFVDKEELAEDIAQVERASCTSSSVSFCSV